MSESKQDANSEKITIKKSTYTSLLLGVIIAVAAATFFAGFLLASSTQTNSNYITKSDFEDIVAKLETKLDNVKVPTQAAQPSQPTIPSIIRVSLDDDPVKGNQNAPLTIVEFSDFQCPFCSRFYQETLSKLEENYISTGKVKFVYKDFPLDNLHPNARPAHIAAECADEQGKFWEYHNILFENQAQWNKLSSTDLSSKLSEYATTLELNAASFESCLSSQKIADEVNADSLQAASYGATGTPTFFIGTEKDGFIKLVGAQPFASFQAAIDNQLG